MSGVTPTTVDVPIGTLSTLPPKHAGPVGRLEELLNGVVRNYRPAEPGVPFSATVTARGGFQALSAAVRAYFDGSVVSGADWTRPQLLAASGAALLTVLEGRPLVRASAATAHWVDHGAGAGNGNAGARVLPRALSQEVVHTSDRIVVAPDSSRITATSGDGGTDAVTCYVWTEVAAEFADANGVGASYVAFRDDDGVELVAPTLLFQGLGGLNVAAIAKTVAFGGVFWVFFNNSSNHITANVYSTQGVLLATTDLTRTATTHTTYWDVTADVAVTLAEPAVDGTDSGVKFYTLSWNGSVITTTTSTDSTLHCNGPVAWLTGSVGSFQYLATLGPPVVDPGPQLYAYEIATRVQTHAYSFGAVVSIPDNLTGYAVTESLGGGVAAYVAYTILSTTAQTVGPPHDPGLRYTQTQRCGRNGTVSTVSVRPQQLLQSRAFKVDDDYYAVSYYQSGSGLKPTATTVSVSMASGGTFLGSPVQQLTVPAGSYQGGGTPVADMSAAHGYLIPTQAIGAITHNAADSAVAATATWTLTNATFTDDWLSSGGTAVNSLLTISSSAHSGNNTTYRVLTVPSAHVVTVDPVGANGLRMVDDNCAAVTAVLAATTTVAVPRMNPSPVNALAWLYANGSGSMTIAGMSTSANNGTFATKVFLGTDYVLPVSLAPNGTVFTAFSLAHAASQAWEIVYPTATVKAASCFNQYTWHINAITADSASVGQLLRAKGLGSPNSADWTITLVSTSSDIATEPSGNATADSLQAMLLPIGADLSIVLAAPEQALTITLPGATFDDSYVNSVLTIGNAAFPENNGSYQILQVLSTHVALLKSLTANSTQRNESFANTATVSVVKPTTATVFQPTWLLTPLSNPSQEIAGAWDTTIAYADWRFDGETDADYYRLCLAGVSTTASGNGAGNYVMLPFRAQEWTTSDEIVNAVATGGAVLHSAIGLKLFRLADPAATDAGAAVTAIGNADTLLLPGPLAQQYDGGQLHEAGIAIGPEQPFVESFGTGGNLTANGRYQYVVCWEISSADGSQIQSIPSPALDVVMPAGKTKVNLGGRMVCPTLWPQQRVRQAVYRTSYQNGAPTTQHYRITNPGTTVALSRVATPSSGGFDTWEFTDNVADYTILSSPTLYTDGLQLPRFCAPPFRGGVADWERHQWAIGYDGAVWMSSEPTEGLATYWNPLWRIPFASDDQPVALAVLETYLIILCERSLWYCSPSNNLPGPVPDASQSLPKPLDLPFPNGCTGYAVGMLQGVAYSSTAGGVWLIGRDLTNRWLSQDIADKLTTVKSMALDGLQRLCVGTGTTSLFVWDPLPNMWYQWTTSTANKYVAEWRGQLVYQDTASVNYLNETAATDVLSAGFDYIKPSVTFSSIAVSKVRQFLRCWAVQLLGTWRGPCTLHATLSYPDEKGAADTLFRGVLATDPDPFLLEINPLIEEASVLGLTLSVDFDLEASITGRSIDLEMISLECGVMSGQSRVSDTQIVPRTP